MKNFKEKALTISLLVTLLFAITSAVSLEPYGLPLDQELHCDDCSSGNVIPNGYQIVYFGETYTKMFVSSNGMISLKCEGSDVTTFSTNLPIIAPFMFDLDTQLINNENVDGTVYYRTEVQPDSDFDQFALQHFGVNFFTSYKVVATFDHVKPKDEQTVNRNTFQAVVYVSAYGDTSVCFNYPSNGLQWPDMSFSDFPIVGFYSGSDLNLQYYLHGSGSVEAANLDSNLGNFGVQGQYCYIVSGLEVVDRCEITSLQCREPHYVYVNSQIGFSDVLSSFTVCADQSITLSDTTLNCNHLNQLVAVNVKAGVEHCTAYLVPIPNVQLGFLGCPQNIVAYAADSTTVDWVAPTPVGDCLVPSSEYISHNPGSSVFQLGTTTVTYIAYDAQFHSATCSFEVTVLPTVRITYEVIDVLNRPIVSASIYAYPDCTPTDVAGRCSVLAPQYHVGDVIPAGVFNVIDINGNLYSVHHDSIQIECFDTKIMIIISPPGFYRSSTGDILPCQEGSYSTTYEASICSSCPVGTYTDEKHATRCDICPVGYSAGEGATECFTCNAGYYLDQYSGTCQICPAGTFSCDRAIDCNACEPGSWSNEGSAECTSCSAGYYFEAGSRSCLPCPANTFSGDRATQCTPCPHGSYSTQGSFECQFCVAGFFFNDNTGACEICPGGYYSCDRATECKACPPGGFASPGSAECAFCNAGYYMGMEADEPCDCYPCPAGTFSCDSAEECQPCPPGTWSMAGASSCYSCYAGYYLDRDCGECEPCPPNTFSADNAFECTPCPEGSYSSAGATECSFCIAGYYFNAATQLCQICPSGTFSNERATECTPCPPGAYSFPGSDTCLFCTAGSYLDSNTATCLPCAAGFFSCDRADSCEACPAGSYSYPGSSSCTFCQAGYYFDVLSQSCLACPTGTFSNERALQCTPCPEGFYSFPGSASCFACTAGFYLDLDLGSCLPCPAGTTSGDRALECILLPTPPANEQVFCQAGFYLDVGTNTCLPCPAGTFSLDRAAQCIPCPSGSYSMVGSSQCIFCTAGYYLDVSLGYCAPCPPNTFSTDRATQCIPCAYGYISDAAASTCTACPSNTVYNPTTHQCDHCTGDSFIIGNICMSCCDWEIPLVCEVCPPGHELDYVCEECCPGYYSPDGKECYPCDDGSYSGNGYDYCVTCPEGTHWDYRRLSCVYDDSSCSSDQIM